MLLKDKIKNLQNIQTIPYALFTLVCAGLFIYVRIRHLDIAFERDEGEYTYAAQEILRGKIPYKDFYNMKTPLVYYALAFLFRLFGDSVHTVKISLLCINLISAFFIFLTSRKLFSTHTGLVASGIYLIFCVSYSAQGWTANAEHFVVFFAMIGLYFLVEARCFASPPTSDTQNSISDTRLFLSGFMMMLAVLCKQQGICFLIFPVLYLLCISIVHRPSSIVRILLSLVLYCCGAALPFAMLVIYLKLHHALYDFYHLCYQYANAYGSIYASFQEIANFHHIYNDTPWLWLFVLGYFFLIMTGIVKEKQSGFLFILFMCCFYAVSLGFFFRPHYFQLIFPVAAMMAAFFITNLNFQFSILKSSIVNRQSSIFSLLLLFFGFYSAVKIQKEYFFKDSPDRITMRMYDIHYFTIKKQLGLELPLHVKDKTGTVCIFGNEPEVFYYSHLRSASGFLYLYPTLESQPYAQEMADKFIFECETRQPETLIYFNGTVPSQNPNTSEYLQNWFDKFKKNYTIIGQIYTQGGEPIIEWKYDSIQNKNKFMYAFIYQR